MDAIAAILGGMVAIYGVIGVVAGVAFVVGGVTRVQNAPVTIGARILLLPGAVALWPLVIFQWLNRRNTR